MRLSTAVDDFLTECRITLAPQTLENYRSDLNLLVSLASVKTGDTVLAFTPALVKTFFVTLSERNLSMSTLHRRRASVSQFAKWCLRHRLIAEDPMADTPSIKRPKKLPRPFTRDAQDKIEALVLLPQERLLRALLFSAGLRNAEVQALRVRDVTLGETEHDGVLLIHGKGKKERAVPIEPGLWHELRDYLLAAGDLRGDREGRLNAFVVARPDGRPFTRKMILKRTHGWEKRAGVEAVTPHRFRHTFATRLLEGNEQGEKADLRQVQELLGHESVATTEIYTQVTAQRLRSAVNVLAKKVGAEKVLFPDSVPAPQVPNQEAATTRNQ